MSNDLSGRGTAALFLGAIWMIILAAMVAAGAWSAPSLADLISRLGIASAMIALAGIAFRAGLDLQGSDAEARGGTRVLSSLPVRVKARR